MVEHDYDNNGRILLIAFWYRSYFGLYKTKVVLREVIESLRIFISLFMENSIDINRIFHIIYNIDF